MNNEHFNLIFNGQLLPGFQKESVIRQISIQFKINEHKVSLWFTKKPVVIKKSLPYHQIVRYKKAFAKLGAKCELGLIVNKSVFESALVKPVIVTNSLRQEIYNTSLSQTTSQSDENFSLYKFDKNFFLPKIISVETATTLENDKQEALFSISRRSWKLGVYSVLIITILSTFQLQSIITNLTLSLFSNNTLATTVGIMSFFLMLILFPKLLWPGNDYEFLGNHDTESVSTLVQEGRYHFFKQKFKFYDANNAVISIAYSRSKKSLRCLNSAGSVLFTAEKEQEMDELLLQTGLEHSKNILDMDFLQKGKFAISFIKTPAFSIRDHKNHIVAIIFPGSETKVIINHKIIKDKQFPLMIASAIIISGV